MKNIFEKVRARFNAATDKNDEQMTLTACSRILDATEQQLPAALRQLAAHPRKTQSTPCVTSNIDFLA